MKQHSRRYASTCIGALGERRLTTPVYALYIKTGRAIKHIHIMFSMHLPEAFRKADGMFTETYVH